MTKKKFIFDEKRKEVKRKDLVQDTILDVTCGVVNKVCDVVLAFLVIEAALATSGGMAGNFMRNLNKFSDEQKEVDIKRWLEGLHTVKRRRWVDANLSLTKEGKQRLQGLFPHIGQAKHWDGNWHIVIFDIPEDLKRKREILRNKLKLLGFGQLQASVWISPSNLLGTVQKEVEELGLAPFVLCAQTANLGEEDSKELAHRVWHIDELEDQYRGFLEWAADKKIIKSATKIFFRYISVIRKDPQLPSELMPEKWIGDEAHKYMRYILSRRPIAQELIFTT